MNTRPSLVLRALCGLALLSACPEDPEPFEPWTLETLAASDGFSLRIPEFDVPSGAELQDCYFVRVPDLGGGEDVWIHRVHMAINPGSHHMNVFRVRTIQGLGPDDGEAVTLGEGLSGTVVRGGSDPTTGECWKSANWSDWPLVANTQNSDPASPYTDWTMPTDVALRLTPGELLMVQTHYVNATTQATPEKGRVGINFHRFTSPNPIELGTLFATQQSIRICRSNQQPSYSGTCRFPPGALTITAANGHFHSRGRTFDVYSWDGTSESQPPASDRFYASTTWAEPPMARDLTVQPPSGGGIWWTCKYQWVEPEQGCADVDARDPEKQGDCCYTFGPIVETSEHCNVFVYYYPKIDDIFCN